MDRDVHVIELLPKGDVPEVDHLLQQETLRTGEILLCAPRLVAHVDHNLSPEENWEENDNTEDPGGDEATDMLSCASRWARLWSLAIPLARLPCLLLRPRPWFWAGGWRNIHFSPCFQLVRHCRQASCSGCFLSSLPTLLHSRSTAPLPALTGSTYALVGAFWPPPPLPSQCGQKFAGAGGGILQTDGFDGFYLQTTTVSAFHCRRLCQGGEGGRWLKKMGVWVIMVCIWSPVSGANILFQIIIIG